MQKSAAFLMTSFQPATARKNIATDTRGIIARNVEGNLCCEPCCTTQLFVASNVAEVENDPMVHHVSSPYLSFFRSTWSRTTTVTYRIFSSVILNLHHTGG